MCGKLFKMYTLQSHNASPCDAVVLVPVLALPHDHHLAEVPRQRVLLPSPPRGRPHRLGPGVGRRAGGAAPGDRQRWRRPYSLGSYNILCGRRLLFT